MQTTQIIILIIACILAYLIGSIPVGFLLARAEGVDIRQKGSGSTGATNVTRILGWKQGVVAGVFDFLKSFLPALIAQRIFHQNWAILIVSLVPVFGHIFPLWLKFKGGKGVATIFGLLAAYFGVIPFLIFLLFWLAAVKLIRLMSLVNLVVALFLPVLFWVVFRDLPHLLFGSTLTLIIWWSHRENIRRLLAGEENRL